MGTVATEEGRMVCAVRVACCQMSSKRLEKGREGKQMRMMCPLLESNQHLALRRGSFYPLN